MSSPVRYSYLWILPDNKADILAASLLIVQGIIAKILQNLKKIGMKLNLVWLEA